MLARDRNLINVHIQNAVRDERKDITSTQLTNVDTCIQIILKVEQLVNNEFYLNTFISMKKIVRNFILKSARSIVQKVWKSIPPNNLTRGEAAKLIITFQKSV